MGVPEVINWTLYGLGAYRDPTGFYIAQLLIIPLFAAVIVLAYWLNKKNREKQTENPLNTSRITNRGWLPEEINITRSAKAVKPRWRNPAWIAFTVVIVCALAFAGFTGVQTYIRYSNPQADLTAGYFEKTLNCTQVAVGDVIEVNVLVDWHGYVFPEFKRQVKIVDTYPDYFELIGGNLTRQYSGYGGGELLQYQLKIVTGNGSIELPKPELYLDNTPVSLSGNTPIIQLI